MIFLIVGIGNDIVEVKRIEKAMENPRFVERVFTSKEIEILEKKGINKYESYAGRFCAKEAVAKAFGTGVRNFSLTDIEILNDESGKPYVVFYNSLAEKNENKKIFISISHSKEYATAIAILEDRI